MTNLFVKSFEFIYNKNMKRLFLLILSFICLGGAVSTSAFYISSSLNAVETRGGSSPSDILEDNKNLDIYADWRPEMGSYWTDSGNCATSFAGGSGTESDPYLISTPQQLAYLAVLINDSSTNSQYASLYYEQIADLNMSTYTWNAIGEFTAYNDYRAFSGFYNGGGNTISGLRTESGSTSDYSYQGLFGYVRGASSTSRAEIHDVSIVNSDIQGYQNVGGIAGYAYYCDIYSCSNSGDIEATYYVGGIAGNAVTYSEIYNCHNTGTITSTIVSISYAGGIVGYGNTVYNCYNEGNVNGSAQFVGGIVGYNSGSIYNCYNIGEVVGDTYVGGVLGRGMGNVYNCYNTGAVSADSYAAGIAGWNSAQTIRNCSNYGEITGSLSGGIVAYNGFMSGQTGYVYNCVNLGYVNANSSGGLVGFNTPSGYVYNCYWGGDCTLTSGYNTSTGTFTDNARCTTSNAQNQSWYTTSSNWNSTYPWDFTEVWEIDSRYNNGYPSLRYFNMARLNFNSNGGQGVMTSLEVEPNTSVTLPTNTFTRTGYEFAGWALSSTGAVVYADGASITPTASMTLYAVWRAEVYTITLNWQGGSGATWSTIYFRYGGIYVYTDESCSTGIDGSALLNNAERAGFSFVSFTTNADGSGTVMYQDYEYLNLNTIVADDIWYAQWQVNNEAKYDSAGKYWYIENGAIPQTKVTDSTLISALNSATTTGSNYYIAGLILQARVYNGTEYCKWNNNWYEVEPIRWRLTKDSNQTNGYGTTTDINAVLAEIVFVGQYSSAYLGSGAGYSTTAVEEFKKNGIDETYLMDYQNEAYNFGNGTTMYNLYKDYTNMFVASENEINSVSTTTAIEFSDLAKDIIKSYGGTKVYFTRDLGSNYNNIVCFNEVGREVQRFATDYRGVQFTVRFTEYGCVD